MDKSKRGKISDEEAKKMLEEILMEDKLNNEDGNEDDVEDDETDELAPCAGECAHEDTTVEQKFCECIRMAENASRFSLRVMEAMRRLQHEEDTIPTSSAEDIVDYIQANYRDDGDLYAQVRTALKQVCSQGFAMELLENSYHLIGPDAISMNQVTCSNERKECSLSSPIKRPEHRKNDNAEEDACGCDTSSEDETAQKRKSRRQSIRDSRKMSRNHRGKRADDIVVEEAADCSCSVNLTDDECTCENKTQKSRTDSLTDQMPRGPHNRGDTSVRGERQAVVARTGVTRRSNQGRRGTARTVGAKMQKGSAKMQKGSAENEALSQTVDDIYRELEDQNPGRSNENEKELKQWIKRCQEECKRLKRRRDIDN